MPRDEEFRAKEKKFHKMTRDGLVERGAASGEETRISGREQDFDLRQARDSPDSLEDLSAKARHTRQQRPKDGDTPQAEPVEDADASPLENSQPEAHETPHGRNRGRSPATGVPATSRSFPSPAASAKRPPSSPAPQNCNLPRMSCRRMPPAKSW